MGTSTGMAPSILNLGKCIVKFVIMYFRLLFTETYITKFLCYKYYFF